MHEEKAVLQTYGFKVGLKVVHKSRSRDVVHGCLVTVERPGERDGDIG